MKEQGLNAVDQLKGLALDKLKEALGLPTYLNDPPCSLTDSKYTPNANGVKKGKVNMCIIIWFMQLCYKFPVIYWFYWYLLNPSLFSWITL